VTGLRRLRARRDLNLLQNWPWEKYARLEVRMIKVKREKQRQDGPNHLSAERKYSSMGYLEPIFSREKRGYKTMLRTRLQLTVNDCIHDG